MEYTIKKLAEFAGVSTRTLRYYDEIGLLKPVRLSSSGYRIYGEREVDLLQQILFYRSLDMSLEEIEHIIKSPHFDMEKALENHYEKLILKRQEINGLIKAVEKTLAHHKGECKMSNKEKFEAFKKAQVVENQNKYGEEIKEKYGEECVKASEAKFMKLSEEDFRTMQEAEKEMFEALNEVLATGDLESQAAKKVYEKHKKWLSFTWPKYSPEAHKGLGEMYVADERFAKYYNEALEQECVGVLRDIIMKYAK